MNKEKFDKTVEMVRAYHADAISTLDLKLRQALISHDWVVAAETVSSHKLIAIGELVEYLLENQKND